MNTRWNKESGFTLLELLMVVIVIAILAAVALPQYLRVTERSRTGQVLQLLTSVRGSEIRYKAQNDSYTTTVGNLDTGMPTMPATWATPTVSGTGAGANVSSARVGGTNDGDTLQVDLDTGSVCASDATSAADWGVSAAAC